MIRIEDLYSLFLEHPEVSTDSRNIQQDGIFFCLKGEKFDGNEFAEHAIEAGAAYAVIDNPEYICVPKTILVDDVLTTLQQLSAYHRKQFDIPVIGITGTNGKTTTKELLTAVLSKKFNVVATEGNLNNHIGLPLTLLQLRQNTEIAVIEMGANHPGEIEILCKLAIPTAGVITNVGKAHIEGFGDVRTILETKTALYRQVKESNGIVFINGSNHDLLQKAEGIHYIIYGMHNKSVCSGKILSADPLLRISWGEEEREVMTRLVGDWNLENILAAACIGRHFGVEEKAIDEALSGYEPKNMRSQLLKTNDNEVILDAYNANPESMQLAIRYFANKRVADKVLILGDMLELGHSALIEHEAIIELIMQYRFSHVLLVGPVFKSLKNQDGFSRFVDTAEASEYLRKNKFSKQMILVKGSRGIGLERLLEYL